MTTEKKINAKKPVTQDVFLANPCKCPACGSDQVEGGSIEVNAGGAYQAVSCKDCQATWNEVYKLVGYSELVN